MLNTGRAALIQVNETRQVRRWCHIVISGGAFAPFARRNPRYDRRALPPILGSGMERGLAA